MVQDFEHPQGGMFPLKAPVGPGSTPVEFGRLPAMMQPQRPQPLRPQRQGNTPTLSRHRDSIGLLVEISLPSSDRDLKHSRASLLKQPWNWFSLLALLSISSVLLSKLGLFPMHRELAMNVAQQIIWPGTALSDFHDPGLFVNVATNTFTTPRTNTGTIGEDSNLLRLVSMKSLMVEEQYSYSITVSRIPLSMTL